MKNKSKVILGLSAILAVTAGAAATSTFAWFNTAKTGTINFSSMKATKTGNIDLGYLPVDNGKATTVAGNNTTSEINVEGATTSLSSVQDVSTADGKTFFQPLWKGFSTTASSIPTVANTAEDSYYVQFGISVKNTDKTNKMSVFLDASSYIKAVTDTSNTDKCAAMATRVAINKATSNAQHTKIDTIGDNILIWQNQTYATESDTNETSFKYLKQELTAPTGDEIPYNNANNTNDKISINSFTSGFDATDKFTNIAIPAVTTLTLAKANNPILASQIPASQETPDGSETIYLVISIWLEGTSTYCADKDTTSTLDPGAGGTPTTAAWQAAHPLLAAGAVGGSVKTSLQFTGVIDNA